MDPDLCDALEMGAVVAMATDTVYGLVARAEDPLGYERLFKLKGRDRTKPIAVLVGDLEQALNLVEDPHGSLRKAASLWPGPLTVVAPKRADAPGHLGDERGTIGVRCPADEELVLLIERCGPLAASSANRAGQTTLTDAEAVRREFGHSLAVVADGGDSEQRASTVVDVSVRPWMLLREGPVTPAQLRVLLD